VIFLRGDAVVKSETGVAANESYVATTAYDVQALAEQLSASFNRPYIHLARPGILGSSGRHLDRRRPREAALVDAALSRLKAHFGWHRLNLVGQSGGGHLVAALIARRDDIGCAVITSGNTAVAQRNRENDWTADITGHTDFLDPIDHVAEVARHPPEKIIVLTDLQDKRVSASVQTAYVEALRRVGVAVDHRFMPATGALRHDLQLPGILAALTWLTNESRT
jgi:dienelactone hydrolase